MTLNAIIICDREGGFTGTIRDLWSEVYRTKRYASLTNCKHDIKCWAAENLYRHVIRWHTAYSDSNPNKA